MTGSGRKSALRSGWLNPSTGGNLQPTATSIAVAMTVIQNYYDQLQDIDNNEVKLSTEVANAYFEYSNVGAGIGGGFEHTSELKPMKYKEANNGPGG